jgi:hypothetical protein
MIAQYSFVDDTTSAGWVLRDLLLGADLRASLARDSFDGSGSSLGLWSSTEPGADGQGGLVASGGGAGGRLVEFDRVSLWSVNMRPLPV